MSTMWLPPRLPFLSTAVVMFRVQVVSGDDSYLQHCELLFERVLSEEGTRLPSSRRYASRQRTPESGIMVRSVAAYCLSRLAQYIFAICCSIDDPTLLSRVGTIVCGIVQVPQALYDEIVALADGPPQRPTDSVNSTSSTL